MIMTRPLIPFATLLLALALPVGIAHAGEPWPADPVVAERPPDLPSWLISAGRSTTPPATTPWAPAASAT
jgi:hypothetical protein